jgi:alkylation response protein AidB-like acyl-CoA dehydrogenase
MNFLTDNEDLQFNYKRGVRWERFVPLLEGDFRSEDGPGSLTEALELYETSLTEAGEYLAREVAPTAAEIDEQAVSFADGEVKHPPALLANIEGLKRLGVMGLSLPRDVGGAGFPLTVGAIFTECLSRACTNTLLLYAFYQGPAFMILRFGSKDQVERWVKPLCAGDISASVAMTEPDAGSDVGAIGTSAVQEGNHFRVSGRKQFITNGCGDVCIVLARSQAGSKGLEGLSLFIVPRREGERENYRVARPEKKFVIRGSATCELSFDNSCAEMLGSPGAGFAEITTFMNEARLAVALQGLGISQAALAAARGYAAVRVQMGRAIARHELVADMLLDMEAEVAAMRALVYECTGLQDRIVGLSRNGKGEKEIPALERRLRELIPLVKYFVSERTLWVTRTAVQVHGGYGVVQGYDVERHYRDALILPIYEGTSQIQALMSLKDQVKWATARPWRMLAGPIGVEAPHDTTGEALREMAGEYNRAFRFVLRESIGVAGLARAALGATFGAPPRRGLDRESFGYALLSAERLIAMLALTRAAEALLSLAEGDAKRRRLAERFVHRGLALVRMHGGIVRSGDRSTLEALQE